MGTGILAVASYGNPGSVASLTSAAHVAGVTFAVVTAVLALIVLTAVVIRWIRHTDAAMADLRHPMRGGMHATLPAALLVLAVTAATVSASATPMTLTTYAVAVLAIAGGLLSFIMGTTFMYMLFTGDQQVTTVNGAWFIPPVATVIVPMALTPLVPHVDAGTGKVLLGIGYTFYGMGFLLFLLVLGLLFDRLVLHPMPAAPLAPTLWIALGPIAVSSLAAMNLAKAGAGFWGPNAPVVGLISQLFGTVIWGFGLWWLVLAAGLIIRYARTGGIPFHLGWWAFVFPLGAYAAATVNVARAWGSTTLETVGVVLYLLLVAVWATVMIRTLRALVRGTIWVG